MLGLSHRPKGFFQMFYAKFFVRFDDGNNIKSWLMIYVILLDISVRTGANLFALCLVAFCALLG